MKSYQGWNPILHLSEPAASHSSPSTSLCLVKLYLYLLWLHQYSLLAWHPGCFWQAAALTPHSFHPWGFPPDREHGCSFGCSTPPLCPLSLWGSAPQGPNTCPTLQHGDLHYQGIQQERGWEGITVVLVFLHMSLWGNELTFSGVTYCHSRSAKDSVRSVKRNLHFPIVSFYI